MNLKTGNKEYKIEFTFEAALYEECAQTALDFFGGLSAGMGKAEENEGEEVEGKEVAVKVKTEEELKAEASENARRIKAYIGKITNLPCVALTFLYAGLLENHGADADGSVTSKSDAKKIYKQFCAENPKDDKANFYGLFGALAEQMGEDGFFDLIGLGKMMEKTEEQSEQPVKLQDHKKKQK